MNLQNGKNGSVKKGENHFFKINFHNFFTVLLTTGLLVGFSTIVGRGQNSHQTEQTRNTPDQTLRSNATVNPSTLAMELSIPIADFPGRGGMSMPLVFNYTSRLWRFQLTGYGSVGVNFTTNEARYAEKTASGWTSSYGAARIEAFEELYDCRGNPVGEVENYVPPPPAGGPNPPNTNVDCWTVNKVYIKRVRVKLPDGSAHELRKDDVIHNYTNSYDRTGTFLSTDGSRLRLELTGTDGTLFLPNGGKYYFQAPQGDIEYIGYRYEDRHGNRIEFDEQTRTWTDNSGRSLTTPIPLNLGNLEQTVGTQTFSVPGLDGNPPRHYQTVWKNLGDAGVLQTGDVLRYPGHRGCPDAPIYGGGLFGDDGVTRICRGALFNPVVLTEIILPGAAGSQPKYKFQYNSYGEITNIEYPTGASERFEYAAVSSLSYSRSLTNEQTNRGVVNRWVKENPAAAEMHWKYQTFKPPSGGNLMIKTTAPDNQTITERYLESNWGTSWYVTKYGFDNPAVGRPFDERVYAGTTLKSRKLTEYEWTAATGGASSPASRDARVKREINIVFESGETSALAAMTVNAYDAAGSSDMKMFAALNLASSEQYDYIAVPESAAKTETIAQMTARFGGIDPRIETETVYQYDTNYVNNERSIQGLISEQKVIDPLTNTTVSKTEMRYDEYGLLTSGALPAAVAGTWASPNTSYLGNVTSVRSYKDTAGGQYFETHSYYDQYGNVRKMVDGNNNESEIQYSANYACAYPTKTISAVPGGNGSNTAFETTVNYDYNTGLPISTTDANGQTTQMEYNDPLLRPTKTIAPNGHQTIIEYGAGVSETTRFVKTKTQIDAGVWKEGYSWYDGLGRNYKTQSVDNTGGGDIFALTCYDQYGRVEKTSNPFRNVSNAGCSSSGLEWTANTYDVAGRVWKVTTPDGAFVETNYGLATSGANIGTSVTVKDQALKEGRSITNALGQLIRVDEPDVNNSGQLGSVDAPHQPTYYEYDTLSNLTKVKQGGTLANPVQTRTFVYDSLSRLKSATNP